jgi:hypothetical protein
MVTEEILKKFNEWKADLEERLAKHLFDHPESSVPSNLVSTTIMKKPNPSARYEIRESIGMPGVWNVWKDGMIREQFTGPLAHQSATKYLNYMLNEPCVFCGGRGMHRTDCPDFPKSDFPY